MEGADVEGLAQLSFGAGAAVALCAQELFRGDQKGSLLSASRRTLSVPAQEDLALVGDAVGDAVL